MNLPDLIKTGESETVEFKEKFDERCIESLVAFASTRGGVIFIGVSDKTCFNKRQMLQKSGQQQSHNDSPGNHAEFHRIELG